MTRHDEILAETALREVRGLTARQAVLRLFELGLVSRRGCEQRAIRDEVERLEREGSACVFYPDEMPVDNKETNWEKLCASYDAGYAQAQREAASWEAWIGGR